MRCTHTHTHTHTHAPTDRGEGQCCLTEINSLEMSGVCCWRKRGQQSASCLWEIVPDVGAAMWESAKSNLACKTSAPKDKSFNQTIFIHGHRVGGLTQFNSAAFIHFLFLFLLSPFFFFSFSFLSFFFLPLLLFSFSFFFLLLLCQLLYFFFFMRISGWGCVCGGRGGALVAHLWCNSNLFLPSWF